MTVYQRPYFTTIRLTLIFNFCVSTRRYRFFFFLNVPSFWDNVNVPTCLFIYINYYLVGVKRKSPVEYRGGRRRGNNNKRRCSSSIRSLPLHLSRSPANIPSDTRGGEQMWKTFGRIRRTMIVNHTNAVQIVHGVVFPATYLEKSNGHNKT